MSLWCEYRQGNSIDKSIGGGTKGCQTLHMTKFEVRFEFLAEKIGLCDSKYALSCQTYEKIPKIVNIYSKVPKFSRQTRLIAKLNSWKEIWISRLEPPPPPPTPYVGNCRCTPLAQIWPQIGLCPGDATDIAPVYQNRRENQPRYDWYPVSLQWISWLY